MILEKFFNKKITWTIVPEYHNTELGRQLADFDTAYDYKGEFITKSPLSQVYKIQIDSKNYYLKKYNISRKKVQRYLGQSKIQTEWQNLLWFASVGIPVAKVVAYGRETIAWVNNRGILITEELINTSDLADIADHHRHLIENRQWVAYVSRQLARATRIMHQHNFAHNDHKWRNIMVQLQEEQPQIFLIDCPSGMKWYPPFFEYRRIKDLACLDKRAKYELSRTQRLRFYKDYAQCKKLTRKDKKLIRKITRFFYNRE